MYRIKTAIAALAAISLAGGCSTKPRNFSANVAAPVQDRAAFESDYRTCQTLVSQGKGSNFKASAATVLATGVGTVGSGAAIAASGAVGITSTGGATVATAAMPVIGVLIGFGVSRAIRSGRERKFKRNMTACLGEYGYAVANWNKIRKREDPASIASAKAMVRDPTLVQGPAIAEVLPPN